MVMVAGVYAGLAFNFNFKFKATETGIQSLDIKKKGGKMKIRLS